MQIVRLLNSHTKYIEVHNAYKCVIFLIGLVLLNPGFIFPLFHFKAK